MEQSAYSPENRELQKSKYYSELNRTTVFLFVSLIALMSLLLSAGFQKPHKELSIFMYGSIMSLGINLLVYPLGRYLQLRISGRGSAHASQTSYARLAQLIFFGISIVFLIGLALSVSHFFFKAPGA